MVVKARGNPAVIFVIMYISILILVIAEKFSWHIAGKTVFANIRNFNSFSVYVSVLIST